MKKIIFTDESVKWQITDSISENLTDLESRLEIFHSPNTKNSKNYTKLQYKFY